MTGPIVIDTNLLLLLIVGLADKRYIAQHGRLASQYNINDWENVVQIVSLFSEIIALPNTLTEVSNFARQPKKPIQSKVQEKLQEFIEKTYEIYVSSSSASKRDEFIELGLTDAALLCLCSQSLSDLTPTLLSVDQDLLNRANSLGYNIIDKDWRDKF